LPKRASVTVRSHPVQIEKAPSHLRCPYPLNRMENPDRASQGASWNGYNWSKSLLELGSSKYPARGLLADQMIAKTDLRLFKAKPSGNFAQRFSLGAGLIRGVIPIGIANRYSQCNKFGFGYVQNLSNNVGMYNCLRLCNSP
jgi:hypothetical protein